MRTCVGTCKPEIKTILDYMSFGIRQIVIYAVIVLYRYQYNINYVKIIS